SPPGDRDFLNRRPLPFGIRFVRLDRIYTRVSTRGIASPIRNRCEQCQEGGVDEVIVVAASGTHDVPSPEAWWSAVLGSGYRGTVDQLDPDQLEQVRRANLNYILGSGIREVEANVVYAVATKV